MDDRSLLAECVKAVELLEGAVVGMRYWFRLKNPAFREQFAAFEAELCQLEFAVAQLRDTMARMKEEV